MLVRHLVALLLARVAGAAERCASVSQQGRWVARTASTGSAAGPRDFTACADFDPKNVSQDNHICSCSCISAAQMLRWYAHARAADARCMCECLHKQARMSWIARLPTRAPARHALRLRRSTPHRTARRVPAGSRSGSAPTLLASGLGGRTLVLVGGSLISDIFFSFRS